MGRNVVDVVRQSAPVDTTLPYDTSTLNSKTILITGGASGFGEGFTRHWAANGANIFVGDVNDVRGKALVEGLRKETGNQNLHYIHCDVTSWQSQVDFFHTAVKLSPKDGIDAVVANAGITDNLPFFNSPKGLDAEEPSKPNLKCIDVNLTGVLYTTHLAMFYLPRNPGSKGANSKATPTPNAPDRHLLLVGSVASLAPIPVLSLYGTSKHAVLGLFRSLRSTTFEHGVRVNMICPYFIDTPLIPSGGRLLLAGGATGKPEDVVDAGTRLMADTRIMGRALVIGPKVKIDDDWQLVPKGLESGQEKAVWECYADDFEDVDAFTHRFVSLLNSVERVRGWAGWTYDVVLAFAYPFRSLFRR